MSSLFALFLVTSLANILTPGLGVVMIITLAAEYGWRRTMSGALGTALGIAFLFIAGMSGVGVIVASSPCSSRRSSSSAPASSSGCR